MREHRVKAYETDRPNHARLVWGRHMLEDECWISKALLLMILMLSVFAAYVPLILGQHAFVDEGVSRNDALVFFVFPVFTLILMLVFVIVGVKYVRTYRSLALPWIGHKRHVDVIGTVILATLVLVMDRLARRVFGMSYASDRIVLSGPMGTVLLVLYVLRMAVATPFIEEVFWRGYIQPGLQISLGATRAVVLQAVLFALFHLRGPREMGMLFLIGLFYGLWRWRRRSLLPLIVAHMLVNTVACIQFVSDHWEWQQMRIVYDYGRSLERLCMPTGNAPDENNAKAHYTQAFGAFRGRGEALAAADLAACPTDLSSEKLGALRNWISDNREASAAFEAGTRKSYYVREYSSMSFEEIVGLPFGGVEREMIRLMLCRARLGVAAGDYQHAVSDVAACYRFGLHLMGPKPLNEQMLGMAIQQDAIRAALQILGILRAEQDWVAFLHTTFLDATQNAPMCPDFSGQSLVCRDTIQRTFMRDGMGHGRIPRAAIDTLMCDSQFGRHGLDAWQSLDREQTVRLAAELFMRLGVVACKSPAQLRQIGISVRDEMLRIAHGNAFLLVQVPRLSKYYDAFYYCVALRDGLTLTASVMEYETDTGSLPERLEQLVEERYMESMPMDPFSGSPFAYRMAPGDFFLYSYGPNLADDYGTGDDIVLWPPSRQSRSVPGSFTLMQGP